jgi:hypothetical protein
MHPIKAKDVIYRYRGFWSFETAGLFSESHASIQKRVKSVLFDLTRLRDDMRF